MSKQIFANTEANLVEISDGSTGYVLLENGVPEDALFNLIWSSRALVEEKYYKAVIKTHRTYMDLGAKYITTNSYACQPTYYEKAFGTEEGRATVSSILGADWFGKQGGGSASWNDLMKAHARLSADLAVKARSEAGKTLEEVKILGSLPPLVESHRPDLFFEQYRKPEVGKEFFVSHYASLAMEMVQGGTDYILFETSNCWEELECGLEAIRRIVQERTDELLEAKAIESDTMEINIFVSFEGSLRNGAPKGDPNHLKPQPQTAGALFNKLLNSLTEGMVVGEALHPDKKVRIVAKVAGVGFNCAPPEDIVDNLKVLQSEGMLEKLAGRDVKFMVYANLNEREVYDQGFDVNVIEVVAEGDQSSVPPPPTSPTSPIRKRTNMVGTGIADQQDAKPIPFAGYLNFAKHIKNEFGVSCIGGCCGCGPGGIETLAKYLEDASKL